VTAILSVPYIGQVGIGADEHGSDCGAASLAMLLLYGNVYCPTVDTLYNNMYPNGNKYLSYSDLMIYLSKIDWDSDYEVGVSTKDLFWILKNGIAPIALIRYGALSSIRPNAFTGSHFVVVIGMDLDTVYIHDPLNTPASGEKIAVPMDMWETAWSTVGDENPQRSLLVPAKAPNVKIISEPIKYVTPSDSDGVNVRSIPGDLSKKTRLYAIKYGIKIPIYIERDGWGKIDPSSEKWISMDYVKDWKQ
jgi:hypothetical protein